MLVVGLTGGIGSGKSSVSRVFAMLGIPVYDCDSRARSLMAGNRELISGIKELLGEESYLEGELNRGYIASRVFEESRLLARLNSLVHPAVMRDIEEWVPIQKSPYVIVESAILYQSGISSLAGKTIEVQADLNERIERVCRRESCSEDAVRRRIAAQDPIPPCDFVIRNNEADAVWPQVLEIDRKLREEASRI